MATIRKNQANLSPAEWQAFINALGGLRGMGNPKPRYGAFVDVHVRAMSASGMSWGVHSMAGMVGRNFLAWHRRFILRFEQQLQLIDPTVSLPYWDTTAQPTLPAPLNTSTFVSNWGLIRHWNPSFLPSAAQFQSVMQRTNFDGFQFELEKAHNGVHVAVGGTGSTAGQMSLSNSPADPLFWLHHSDIDRIWSMWQATPNGTNPNNLNETLKPTPIIQGKVQAYLDINALNYSYA